MSEWEIRPPVLEELPALKALWTNAFSEEGAYVDFLFEQADLLWYALGAFQGGTLAGMLFSLPCVIHGAHRALPSRYVYGVATDPAFRGQGIMTRLEAAASARAKEEGAAAMLLVPAGKSLFAMYQKLGYRTCFYRSFSRLPLAIHANARLAPCDSFFFLSQREKLLAGQTAYVELSPLFRRFRYEDLQFTGAQIWRDIHPDGDGYLIVRPLQNRLLIWETDLRGRRLSEAAGKLAEQTGAGEIRLCGNTGVRIPYGMGKALNGEAGRELSGIPAVYCNLMLNE